MFGVFAGGKNSFSCVRPVVVNCLLEERPCDRFKEQLRHELRSGVCERSAAFWTAWESFEATLLLASEATVGLADAYM